MVEGRSGNRNDGSNADLNLERYSKFKGGGQLHCCRTVITFR